MSLEEIECGHGFEEEQAPFIEKWEVSEDDTYYILKLFGICGKCGGKFCYEQSMTKFGHDNPIKQQKVKNVK